MDSAETRIENKRLLATFMNYANGKPLTPSLLDTLYNDWNSIIPIVQEIKRKAVEMKYLCIEGLESRFNTFNYDKTSILKACIEFVKWYNQQRK
jgi:hypothetical protein